ncbi:hypothetical protein GF389_00090 [Candidatus Dojkabacteria bacterium]|nr:hypothetical protein [Candidatus Dojkabacteria bacterium]
MEKDVPVLNLKELYGQDYRVSYDPAVEKYQKKTDPVYFVINGTYGHFYPYSDKHLAVWVNGKRRISNVKKWDGLTLTQEGDDEAIFIFLPDMFERVAKKIKVYKRPRVSDEERQLRSERLKTQWKNKLKSMVKRPRLSDQK